MPSTYSTSLKLELIGNGEQAGAWGTTTNNNLGTLIEQAITGVLPLTIYGDTTLTNYNGLSDQARNAVLFLTGNLTSSANVIAPSGQQKTYIVRNRTGATVNLKTTGGNAISIANAASEVVFTDGTDFYSATQFNYINGDLTVTGNVTVGGQVIIGGDLYGNTNNGQWYIPTGNTAVRAANGTNGLFRYNNELQIYEGYQNNVWVKFITANELNYAVNYMVVAGGGGGGQTIVTSLNSGSSGGGGAGGYFSGTTTFTSGAVFTMTVGAGGPNNTNGYNSSITGLFTAIGGGHGGSGLSDGQVGVAGSAGGSGGGGGCYGVASGGNGTTGQGNAGASSSGQTSAGGGGGAGVVGSGTSGGAGAINTITGASVYYAGGGGGANGGAGGAGGGGAGGSGNGQSNTGGGGGGANNGASSGGSGGSGVIILSIPTASYTGITTGTPTVSVAGSNTVLVYNNSGTYTA
jgi:hypothetical protein